MFPLWNVRLEIGGPLPGARPPVLSLQALSYTRDCGPAEKRSHFARFLCELYRSFRKVGAFARLAKTADGRSRSCGVAVTLLALVVHPAQTTGTSLLFTTVDRARNGQDLARPCIAAPLTLSRGSQQAGAWPGPHHAPGRGRSAASDQHAQLPPRSIACTHLDSSPARARTRRWATSSRSSNSPGGCSAWRISSSTLIAAIRSRG